MLTDNCLIDCKFSNMPLQDKGNGQMGEERQRCGDVMKERIKCDFPEGIEMDEGRRACGWSRQLRENERTLLNAFWLKVL